MRGLARSCQAGRTEHARGVRAHRQHEVHRAWHLSASGAQPAPLPAEGSHPASGKPGLLPPQVGGTGNPRLLNDQARELSKLSVPAADFRGPQKQPVGPLRFVFFPHPPPLSKRPATIPRAQRQNQAHFCNSCYLLVKSSMEVRRMKRREFADFAPSPPRVCEALSVAPAPVCASSPVHTGSQPWAPAPCPEQTHRHRAASCPGAVGEAPGAEETPKTAEVTQKIRSILRAQGLSKS